MAWHGIDYLISFTLICTSFSPLFCLFFFRYCFFLVSGLWVFWTIYIGLGKFFFCSSKDRVMRLVLHTLILGNVLFGRAALVGCAPQGMDLLSAQIAMFVLFFSFSFFCAFSFVSVCFTFFRFCFSYSCTTSSLSCCLFIRYLEELRSAQRLSDIGGWHHHHFFYSQGEHQDASESIEQIFYNYLHFIGSISCLM